MGRESLLAPDAAAELVGGAAFLDVRWRLGADDGHDLYLAGHVPGAAYVDLATDLADPPGDGSRGRHPLPDPERFAAAMRRCGVRGDRPVVVYDEVSGASAARAWWLLRHHGHPDVRLVDGGWTAYAAAGGPVARGEEPVTPGDFVAGPGALPVVDADGAARVARDGVLIDARAAERYRGETEPVDPVAGHIPGAVNVPNARNLIREASTWRGRFMMLDDLDSVYEAAYRRAGMTEDSGPSAEVAVYCGSGVTAAHDVFALHLLGVHAALYPGSWSEWVADPSRPVATGEDP